MSPRKDGALPLCVDLDGTLLRTDLLAEGVAALARSSPFSLLALPFWLLGGRARLKREVERRTRVDVAALPYNERLLEHLKAEKARGRDLILVTGADEEGARRVAEHLGLFSARLASDGTTNLRGPEKARRLEERFGARGFDYAGNERDDLVVWEKAAGAVVCGPSPSLAREAARRAPLRLDLTEPRPLLRALASALRPHQWAKNLLIFLPAVTSHRVADAGVVGSSLLAFAAFSLGASAGYVLNDALDVSADRAHAEKRRRPFASGELPLAAAPPAALALAGAALALALALPESFRWALLLYLALTALYSAFAKKVVLLDVCWLALLYFWRVLAGLAATGIPQSPWIFAFCLFLFFSLALGKRVAELQARGGAEAPGRGYRPGDAAQLSSLGAASACSAVLVFALYADSQKALSLYRHPYLLWTICPILLYWVSRFWLVVHRGGMQQDPLVFALRDRASYAAAAAAGLVVLLAS